MAMAMAMARTSSGTDRRFIRSFKRFLPLSALIAFPASAAQWQVTTYMSVDQHYTDNVSLAPPGQERSEWVTQLRPGFTLSYNGPKTQFDFSYTPNLLWYANSGETKVIHELSARSGGANRTSWELVPEFLFFDTSIDVTQRTTSLLGPQTQLAAPETVPLGQAFNPQAQRAQLQASVNTAGNTTTVLTGVASPYIKQRFGEDAIATVRYTFSVANAVSGATPAAGDAFSDSTGSRLDARIESGPSYVRTRWYAAYYKNLIDYSDNASDTTLGQFVAGAQHLIKENLYLTAAAGYDGNKYVTSPGVSNSGPFWNVGLNWTPTPRTNLSAIYGRRYYGPNYGFDFSHRMRLLVVNASYREDITTARSQLLQPLAFSTAGTLDALLLGTIPDPVARQQAVQALIAQGGLPSTLLVPVQFSTTNVYLSKSWRASIGLQGARHTLLGYFFNETRESQQTGVSAVGDFALSSTIKQTGASANWSWRINPNDTNNFTLGRARNEFSDVGREDDITYFYWTLSHAFSPKLTGALSYRRLNSESNLPGPGNYTENAAIASLRMTF
jgi:uncharacterized protein (PEP-CTERM system associated)